MQGSVRSRVEGRQNDIGLSADVVCTSLVADTECCGCRARAAKQGVFAMPFVRP